MEVQRSHHVVTMCTKICLHDVRKEPVYSHPYPTPNPIPTTIAITVAITITSTFDVTIAFTIYLDNATSISIPKAIAIAIAITISTSVSVTLSTKMSHFFSFYRVLTPLRSLHISTPMRDADAEPSAAASSPELPSVAPHIEDLVEQVSKLNLLEVRDFVKLLKVSTPFSLIQWESTD